MQSLSLHKCITFTLLVFHAVPTIDSTHTSATCTSTTTSPTPPTPPASPFVTPLPALIGQYNISIPLPNTSSTHCCATNYTAAWDLHGELLALSVDNFFCPDFAQHIHHDALQGANSNWDTYQDVLLRKSLYNRPSEQGYNTLRIQNKYTGFFPGQTKIGIDDNIQLVTRECLKPVMDLLLASPMFQHSEPDQVPTHLRSKPIHSFDQIHARWKTNTSSIPLIPIFGRSFYASVSLLPEDLHVEHQWPHADSSLPGLASVYTITKDKAYDVAGTAVVHQPGTKISLINSKQTNALDRFQTQAKRLSNKLPNGNAPPPTTTPNTTGWNSNANHSKHATTIVLALNKHNRITLYPRNRLHFAYIPLRSLLQSDPGRGRLTLNSFWDVYSDAKDTSSKSFMCQKLNQHYNSLATKDIGQRDRCELCTAWRHCVWCNSTESCVGVEEVQATCPSLETIAAYSAGTTATTCSSVNNQTLAEETKRLSTSHISIEPTKFNSRTTNGILFQIKTKPSNVDNSFTYRYLSSKELLSARHIESVCYKANPVRVRRAMLGQWVGIIRKTERAVDAYKGWLKRNGGSDSKIYRRWLQNTLQTIIHVKRKVGKCLFLLKQVFVDGKE